jgi:hypothetical protein
MAPPNDGGKSSGGGNSKGPAGALKSAPVRE